MVSITVHLKFDYALFFIFCPLWQALIENGARSEINLDCSLFLAMERSGNAVRRRFKMALLTKHSKELQLDLLVELIDYKINRYAKQRLPDFGLLEEDFTPFLIDQLFTSSA